MSAWSYDVTEEFEENMDEIKTFVDTVREIGKKITFANLGKVKGWDGFWAFTNDPYYQEDEGCFFNVEGDVWYPISLEHVPLSIRRKAKTYLRSKD